MKCQKNIHFRNVYIGVALWYQNQQRRKLKVQELLPVKWFLNHSFCHINKMVFSQRFQLPETFAENLIDGERRLFGPIQRQKRLDAK